MLHLRPKLLQSVGISLLQDSFGIFILGLIFSTNLFDFLSYLTVPFSFFLKLCNLSFNISKPFLRFKKLIDVLRPLFVFGEVRNKCFRLLLSIRNT